MLCFFDLCNKMFYQSEEESALLFALCAGEGASRLVRPREQADQDRTRSVASLEQTVSLVVAERRMVDQISAILDNPFHLHYNKLLLIRRSQPQSDSTEKHDAPLHAVFCSHCHLNGHHLCTIRTILLYNTTIFIYIIFTYQTPQHLAL